MKEKHSTAWLPDPTWQSLRSCKCLELMLFFQPYFPSPSMLNHSKLMPTQQRVNETPQLLLALCQWFQGLSGANSLWQSFHLCPGAPARKWRTKRKWNMGTAKVWEHRQDAIPFPVVIQQRAERNTAESEAGTAKSIWCQKNRRNPRAGSSWHSKPCIAISKATQSSSVLVGDSSTADPRGVSSSQGPWAPGTHSTGPRSSEEPCDMPRETALAWPAKPSCEQQDKAPQKE